MASRTAAPTLQITPPVVVLAALLSAFVAGVAMARSVPLGVGVAIALCYAPLVLINLPVGIALWLPLVFLTSLSALRFGPTLAGMLIVFAWFGTLLNHGSTTLELLRRQRRYLAALALFAVWIMLSMAWSKESAAGGDIFFAWIQAALVYLIVATTFSTGRHVQLVAWAFVAGAVASVLVGLVETGLQTSETALETATDDSRRLGGGAGDPNYLAAGIVPAAILVAALATGTRRTWVKWASVGALAVLTVGFGASESRGGLVAAVVAIVAGFMFFKHRRPHVLALVLLIVGVGAAWFSVNPAAWQRITSFDEGGTGRTELWDVAWRMWQDHPVTGVGLDNFSVRSPLYADQAGPLENANFIAEVPYVAHNVYVQLLAETGLIGLLLFLLVALGSLRAAWLAAGRFDALRDSRMAALSRGVLVAGLTALAASFFLSNGHDRRSWILFALGPALLALAQRRIEGPAEGARLPSTTRRPAALANLTAPHGGNGVPARTRV